MTKSVEKLPRIAYTEGMDTFAQIIGQEIVVSHLQNALLTGGVSHAYILNGAKGSGRHMIARSFSAALLCENPIGMKDGAPEPCGVCLSCIQAASESNPDILTLKREKEGSIGVGDIRNMRADVQVKPYRSSRKIYIIPDAERMTVQAQNALLKTLEEPPPYAVLLLLADGTGGFLPTVLSRCITLPLRPVPETAVESYLEEHRGAEPEHARLCARFSGGSIGKALLLLENEGFVSLRERTIELLRSISKKNAADLAAFARETASEDGTQDLLDFILSWNRDLLVFRSTCRTGSLIFTDQIQYIKEAAQRLSWQALQTACEAVYRARRRLSSNVNAELTLQMMLLELREAYSVSGAGV